MLRLSAATANVSSSTAAVSVAGAVASATTVATTTTTTTTTTATTQQRHASSSSSSSSPSPSSSSSIRGQDIPWQRYWTHNPAKVQQPDGSWNHPNPQMRLKYRKKMHEWRQHHGHGMKIGHMGKPREMPDWEHADGTPSPHNPGRYSFLMHKHGLVMSAIKAGAIVERMIKDGQMPKIPSTAIQRDWDPEIPLFLEDTQERGGAPAPEWFEAPRRMQAVRHETDKSKWRADSPAEAQVGENARSAEDGDEVEVLQQFTTSSSAAGMMMASSAKSEYEPSSFIDEPVLMQDNKRPHWNRRLWTLTDEFLIQKPQRNKNTIGSD